MEINVSVYFILFIIYAMIGWCIEIINGLIQTKKFVNRGFLIGPYCPIYGVGGILITLLLSKYYNDPIVLFFMGIAVCGILEYLTSYIMEKIFKARWWDYSQKKFNINGRVCLGTIIPFGLLGLLIIYILNPFFLQQIGKLSEIWLNILSLSLLIIYICDNIVSGIIVRAIKTTEKGVSKDLDNTEEITQKVKEVLQGKSILHRRLINAYPKIQAVKLKVKEKKEKIKKRSEEIYNNIEEKNNSIKQNLEQKNIKIKEKIHKNKMNDDI